MSFKLYHLDTFVKNPQYMFTLIDPDTTDDQTTCSMIISLAQRVDKRKTEHSIGFKVYKVRFLFLYLHIDKPSPSPSP